METNNGGLFFEAGMDNEKLKAGIEETIRRIQGLSDASVKGGKAMDEVFDKVSADITSSFEKIDFIVNEHKDSIKELEKEYRQIGLANRGMSIELGSGGYLTERQQAIAKEVRMRKALIKEAEEAADKLHEEEIAFGKLRKKVEENTTAHQSLRSRMRELKEEMASMIDQGINEQSEAYKALTAELGRLQDIQDDIAQQGKVLANDESSFQGVIAGLSGLAGGFSSATGAMSLFASENENLQAVMAKIQSVMAITIGMQQVSQALNKDSAFRLVTLAKAKDMVSAASLRLGTAFVRMGLSANAAKVAVAGLYAVSTVGVSLAISGIIYLIDRFREKQEEAKRAAEQASEAYKKQQEYLSGIGQKYAEQIAVVETYRSALNAENVAHKDKLKIIDKLKEIIPDYTATLNDEGRVMWENKEAVDAYMSSLEKSLKFKAAMEDLTKEYAEIYRLESTPQRQPETKDLYINGNTIKVTDYDALAKKYGATDAGGLSPSVINAMKEQEEAALELTKSYTEKQVEERKNRVKQIQEYISAGNLLESTLKETKGRALEKQTKETGSEMLDEFRASLSKRMDEARTVLEMIDIIKKERQSIEGDSSDIGKQKQKVLNDKEQDVLKQAKQETVKLMQNYESYIDAKISMDREYSDDLALLERARAEASTDAERQSIDRSIALRKRQYEKDKKGSGDERYDEMLSAYGSFEQKKLAIMQEYEEKRTKAQEHGNNEMIAKLNEAQARAISSLATEELMNTDVWSNLFGNLDELTSKQIGTLVVEIERNFKTLSGVFNPVDLAKIRNKLNEAREILIRDNPFKSMGESLKAVFNEAGDASKDSAQDIKRNWKRLAESTENSFDFVKDAINSADFLKDAIGDVGATAIGSMQAIVAVAITVASAMNTVESASVVLVIIKAVLIAVQAVVSVVKSIVGSADKQIEKSIQRHAEAAERLKNTYEDLKRATQDALGSSVYEHQKAAIENLKLQQQNLQARIAAEKMKKKPDRNKIKEYEDQYRQAGYEIKDIIKDVTNDVLQTDAKTLADDLGDALVNAFARGEDAAKSLKKTTEDVIRNIVVNQLKKQFLEKQLGGALDKLYKSAGGKEGGVFSFNDLTDEALKSFENDVKNIANGFTEGMKRVSKIIKTANESPEVSLSGAVKGVTEETASMVAGQMNAIRINQMEATNMLRQQLFHLSNIDRNTGSIDKNTKYIKAIYDKISSGDTLRAKGLQ